MTEVELDLEACHRDVCELLDRRFNIDALSSLTAAINFELAFSDFANTVIAFDANVILRLSGHRRSDDIVDYLRTSFPGKLLLPGQVIQEFWNNQFQAVTTKSLEIRKKFSELGELVDGLDQRFGDFSDQFKSVLLQFSDDFGYLFDDNTVRRTQLILELLREKARVPFMPRSLLSATAHARKRTKTPPGFKDDLDGDFYVWSDLLLGVAMLKREGFNIQRLTLVTLDKKVDWSREGVPHPILSAEVAALCGAIFETVTIDALAKRLLD